MTSLPLARRLRIALGAALVLGLATALFTYEHFFREQPPPHYESDEDHFLFGSVGTEARDGVPYWVWLVLPRIFPDLLPGPGGYASLGVLAREGAEMPVGLTKVSIGYTRVGTNCALCHVASVRLASTEPPALVPAAPAQQDTGGAYRRFLKAAAGDPRFTADTILAEIAKNYRLTLKERLLYRFAIIPATRRALLGLGAEHGLSPIGPADVPPLWNLEARGGRGYHWDGLNTDLREVVTASAIGGGASPAWVDRDYLRWNSTAGAEMSSLQRVMRYIGDRQPPAFPFPIDRRLAGEGASVYRAECATCHAPGGGRLGAVVPVAEVGTDRGRSDAWTPASAAAYNAFGAGRIWAFSRFRTTGGYLAVPHDGLWLRGPYLHNGSVPSLADLLEPEERRPVRFWRGHDVIDAEKVGFVADGEEARRSGTLYDTTRPGNSNAGHPYGTALPPERKRALLEYLKTL